MKQQRVRPFPCEGIVCAKAQGYGRQGQVRQMQIIMYGRFEGTNEARKKKVRRSEARGRRARKPKGMAPELQRKVREKSRGPITYCG